ncbi:hypothetical protein ODU72_04770 [Lactobacillus amylovorus]|uniref:Uncharacterized protein n=1 Tax=Lactobacillus amylovorus TaxID=1604 RepID=A0A9X3W483_LACAM|nr:hypothetical protein [Lactobacillus amylovorus]MDB6257991.1 hypothetical protein [Lactobacillus amylovorus]
MADIKFMDISENDNPATTDSILVGNQENGVKRTTLGKIGDMFAVHGLLHFEQTNTVFKAQTICYPIAAPDIEGYQFAFWLNPATTGWTASTYIDSPASKQADIWVSNTSNADLSPFANGKNGLTATAVYIKNSVA